MPSIIHWRLKNVVLHRVLGPKELVALAEGRDKDSCRTNHVTCDRSIPYGATGWSLSPDGPWKRIEELPREWGLVA